MQKSANHSETGTVLLDTGRVNPTIKKARGVFPLERHTFHTLRGNDGAWDKAYDIFVGAFATAALNLVAKLAVKEIWPEVNFDKVDVGILVAAGLATLICLIGKKNYKSRRCRALDDIEAYLDRIDQEGDLTYTTNPAVSDGVVDKTEG